MAPRPGHPTYWFFSITSLAKIASSVFPATRSSAKTRIRPLPKRSARRRLLSYFLSNDSSSLLETHRLPNSTRSLPESHLKLENKAMFQLKNRLERHKASVLKSSMPMTDEDEDVDDNEGYGTDNMPALGVKQQPKRKRAMLGRMRTHNEQLMLRSCGICIGRHTCITSASVTQVAVGPDRLHINIVLSSFLHRNG